MLHSANLVITDFLRDTTRISWVDGIPCVGVPPDRLTMALAANAQYFGHPKWAESYFNACHRDREFIERWRAATGSWDDKIVIDIGCGPGNVFASLGGAPAFLLGVDISLEALKMAERLGYQVLCADAQDLPLHSEIADIVVINATIHHCDNMKAALQEAARLVKPGGILVSDHDLQKTAWHFKGLARLLWHTRLPLYRLIQRGGHTSDLEQQCALATEAHHVVGDGVSVEFYHSILEPMGFSVQVYPHNHDVGASIFEGQIGRSQRKYRLAQWLSGINPDSPEAALSLMCVAKRSEVP